ncbi:MAG TPA: pyrrolo-quinoline quinone, partial [Candidatus Dormibacteraeota bacterium]|nr:pyrrolo-quinoline quinone [Candidatus Dormibacteraeota bacterium]
MNYAILTSVRVPALIAALSVFFGIGAIGGCGGPHPADSNAAAQPAASSSSESEGVAAVPSGPVNVFTYHNDNARTGLNDHETLLTHRNVNSRGFGKIGFLPVQGLVDAEPLYVSQLPIARAKRNVVFVATEHDLV